MYEYLDTYNRVFWVPHKSTGNAQGSDNAQNTDGVSNIIRLNFIQSQTSKHNLKKSHFLKLLGNNYINKLHN